MAIYSLCQSEWKRQVEAVYLHGHDHVMQHFVESDKPLYHFGNGVGGMGKHPLQRCDNCTEFKWGTSAYGFAVHEIGDTSMIVHFVDATTQQVSHSVEVPFHTWFGYGSKVGIPTNINEQITKTMKANFRAAAKWIFASQPGPMGPTSTRLDLSS